ncbi:hypothetical protein ACTFIW_000925 [Dictyostelium discoideum]
MNFGLAGTIRTTSEVDRSMVSLLLLTQIQGSQLSNARQEKMNINPLELMIMHLKEETSIGHDYVASFHTLHKHSVPRCQRLNGWKSKQDAAADTFPRQGKSLQPVKMLLNFWHMLIKAANHYMLCS